MRHEKVKRMKTLMMPNLDIFSTCMTRHPIRKYTIP